MMDKLIPKYQDELKELKEKMLDAQKFAEVFPIFSDRILECKFTKEFTGKMGHAHKGMYFDWGINRWFYREKANITNYRGDFEPQYLWNIYINSYSLFGDDYVGTGLYDLKDKTPVFFFDASNTTFYATDEQVVPLLDVLAEWYAQEKSINDEARKEKRKEQLRKELEKLA